MKVLNDFYCPKCHHVTEGFQGVGTRAIPCEQCGGAAQFTLRAPRFKLDGTDPAFTTAWDKWAKVHEAEAERARKRDDFGGIHHGDN